MEQLGKGLGAMRQSGGFLPFPCLWPYLYWAGMEGVGQEGLKAAPFPELSREKDSTSSLGFAFLIHDSLLRKLTLIPNSLPCAYWTCSLRKDTSDQ